MVPVGEHWLAWLDDDQIRALPVTVQLDLAQFIDQGRRRLEMNYLEWEEALRRAGPLEPQGVGKAAEVDWSSVSFAKGSDGVTLSDVNRMFARRKAKRGY